MSDLKTEIIILEQHILTHAEALEVMRKRLSILRNSYYVEEYDEFYKHRNRRGLRVLKSTTATSIGRFFLMSSIDSWEFKFWRFVGDSTHDFMFDRFDNLKTFETIINRAKPDA